MTFPERVNIRGHAARYVGCSYQGFGFWAMTLEELVSLKHLNDAFYRCSVISHWKESTQRYRNNLLLNNVTLREEVLNGTYRISKTIDFTLSERGKTREIHAPVIRDRVLQKVVVQHVLIPYLAKPLIYDNYASLKRRGTTFARKRFEILMRRYMAKHGRDGYILQIDISKYFDSINHGILKRMVHERIHEPPEIMNLIDYLIDTASVTGEGLNLGAEAPQIFAIYYLSGIDSWIKVVKGIKYYGRYMDDMFILSDSKEELKDLLAELRARLGELKLAVNERKTHIVKLKHGFTYLQIKYTISESGLIVKRPTRAKVVRERRRLKRFRGLCDAGRMKEYDVMNCYKSWRQSVIGDCNACYVTIKSMDEIFRTLFPDVPQYMRRKRSKVIKTIFKEADYEDLRHQR